MAPDDPERPEVFMLAAQLFDRVGRAAEAADAWAQSAAESSDDGFRVRALNAEGQSARLTGDWGRAAAAHSRALQLSESTFGETLETAAIAQNLAMVFKYTGRFDEARALYIRALATAEAGNDQRIVAVICHNLGGLAHARGDHAEGIPWARRSVEVRERLDDPLGLAADQGALAGLLIDAGELDEAAELLHDARAVFVAELGEDDHEIAVVDGNLATIALRRNDLSTAERHARAAWRSRSAASDPTIRSSRSPSPPWARSAAGGATHAKRSNCTAAPARCSRPRSNLTTHSSERSTTTSRLPCTSGNAAAQSSHSIGSGGS